MAVQRNEQRSAKVVAVSTKSNYRRAIPKTYSYRYEVAADAGPADDPIVCAGAAIIEGRYRGRSAAWNVGRSMMDDATYLARGSYVHPLEENPMAYPPRHLPADVKSARTPGFAAGAAQKIKIVPELGETPQIGKTSRRDARRATHANEPAYRKTG